MISPRRIKSIKSPVPKKGNAGKVFFYFLLVCFFSVTFYLLFFSGYLAIGAIEVNGVENISQSDMKNNIESKIEGKYLNILPKNNLLLVKPNQIEKKLTEEYEKIKSVSIKKKFPSSLLVNIEEKKLALIFFSQGKYFLVDDSGAAFEEITEASPEFLIENLPIIKENGNLEVSHGRKIIDPRYIGFLVEIKKMVSGETDVHLTREISTPNRISGDLRILTEEGWSIYFDASISPAKEIGMLKAVLDGKISSETRSNLEYIDLRVDNKVFYKFKEGTEEEMKTEDEKSADQQPKVEGSSDKKNKKKK